MVRLTGVLGHGNDLGQELGKVRQVLAEEAGLENQGLSGVRGRQLTAQEFGFARDAEGRSPLRVLTAN